MNLSFLILLVATSEIIKLEGSGIKGAFLGFIVFLSVMATVMFMKEFDV